MYKFQIFTSLNMKGVSFSWPYPLTLQTQDKTETVTEWHTVGLSYWRGPRSEDFTLPKLLFQRETKL